MFEFQKHGRYFAQCARGVEDLLVEELRELGASEAEVRVRGVGFRADSGVLYDIVLRSRLAGRILAPLLTFDCHSDRYLYATARKLDWEAILSPERTFAIVANVSRSNINHSQFAAQRLKDAIVDHFRESCGRRPSVDRHEPDLWLNLHLNNNRATISLDVSGGSLHRRGYRRETVEAPLQETLAAAVLRLSGWDGASPLVDFMCGSGTFLAEAWLQASHIPPGWLGAETAPPTTGLPDFDAETWRRVVARARADHRSPPPGLITGSDVDAAAVSAARTNLSSVPGGEAVLITRADFRDVGVPPGAVIVVNPPYGVRLQQRHEVEALYKDLGDHLKRKCNGTTAWVLCGDVELVKRIGLRPKRRIPLWNGGLECRLVQLELY